MRAVRTRLAKVYLPTDPADPAIEIIRSTRRKRTLSARVEDGRVVVRVPAGMSAQEERAQIAKLLPRLARKHGSAESRATDAYLRRRAREVAGRWLDVPGEQPVYQRLREIRWTAPMRTRWASCTPATGTIRISSQLQRSPQYVLDYILVHELVHLRIAGHDAEFWRRVHAYPNTDRAHGFLQAWSLFLGDGQEPPEMADADPADWGDDEPTDG